MNIVQYNLTYGSQLSIQIFLIARNSWNSGDNFSMEIFANSMKLTFMLRRNNINMIQYNVETIHAVQLNS
jgi:hypothetical protein